MTQEQKIAEIKELVTKKSGEYIDAAKKIWSTPELFSSGKVGKSAYRHAERQRL